MSLGEATRTNASADATTSNRPVVAYVMSRFPKITETFIVREMLAVEDLDVAVEVFPLQREPTQLMQPEAAKFVAAARFTPILSWAIVVANLRTALRRPILYIKVLATLLRANFGSARYFAGAMAFFPKAVYFAQEMQRSGVSHLHAHFASHPAAVAYVVHRLSNISYSFTAHGSDLHRDQHMLREKVAAAAFVVAISEYNREVVLQVCGAQAADKVQVVHCGVDRTQFAPRTRPTDFACEQGSLTLLCIGTLHEVKGQIHLLRACRILHEQGRDFACHFLGSGPDLEKLQAEAKRLEIAERVIFHGACTSVQVRERLQQADVVVAPSVPSRDGRREGIPVVLMEAMAAGVPCVSSRLSGIPELVDDGITGLLTTPGDEPAIAEAIQRLASDRLLRSRMAAAGIEKVACQFDLTENARKLAKLFVGN